MFKKAKKNKKGFTLAELLIVVAIIAVLVAISIPIFTSQLEKSRDAVSVANIRAAYAEAQSAYLTGSGDGDVTYNITNDNGTIAVKGVQLKGTKSSDNFSGLAADLPFISQTVTLTEPAAGEYYVVFTYTNGAISSVEFKTTLS